MRIGAGRYDQAQLRILEDRGRRIMAVIISVVMLVIGLLLLRSGWRWRQHMQGRLETKPHCSGGRLRGSQ